MVHDCSCSPANEDGCSCHLHNRDQVYSTTVEVTWLVQATTGILTIDRTQAGLSWRVNNSGQWVWSRDVRASSTDGRVSVWLRVSVTRCWISPYANEVRVSLDGGVSSRGDGLIRFAFLQQLHRKREWHGHPADWRIWLWASAPLCLPTMDKTVAARRVIMWTVYVSFLTRKRYRYLKLDRTKRRIVRLVKPSIEWISFSVAKNMPNVLIRPIIYVPPSSKSGINKGGFNINSLRPQKISRLLRTFLIFLMIWSKVNIIYYPPFFQIGTLEGGVNINYRSDLERGACRCTFTDDECCYGTLFGLLPCCWPYNGVGVGMFNVWNGFQRTVFRSATPIRRLVTGDTAHPRLTILQCISRGRTAMIT